MPFDWNSEDENPVLSDGYHFIEVVKARTTKSDGAELTSKDGERMIWVTVLSRQTQEDQDVCLMLEGRGVFNLKTLMKHSGANTEKMKENGVTPIDFGNQAFAEKQLVGRKCWAYAERRGIRTNIRFIPADDVPPQYLKPSPATKPAIKPPPNLTPPQSFDGPSQVSVDPNAGTTDSEIPF